MKNRGLFKLKLTQTNCFLSISINTLDFEPGSDLPVHPAQG